MKKKVFSKIIVTFCVLEMAFVQLWAMKIAAASGVMVTDLLLSNHSVFAGELTLLCLKTIFAKSDTITTEQVNNKLDEAINKAEKERDKK